MTTDKKTPTDIPEMSPQLIAFEAMLGTFRSTSDSSFESSLKSVILAEQCRLIEEELQPETNPETRRKRLVETIRQAEAEDVSSSFNQYTKQLRFVSLLFGLFIGVAVGVVLTFAGFALAVHWLSISSSQGNQPVREIHHYNYWTQEPDLPFSGDGAANR